MNKTEILNYIAVGRYYSVTVDRILLKDFGNIIREICFQRDNQVRVSYLPYGMDEGGYDIYLTYDSIDLAICSIEDFLNKKLENWENFNKSGSYPEEIGKDFENLWEEIDLGINSGEFIPKNYVRKIIR